MSATATTTAAQAETAPSPLTQIPTLFRHLIAPFPLVTYPPARTISKRSVHIPTLWIHPPLSTTPDTKPDLLSRDAECLKWQAHLALRGVQPLAVRWDVTPSGALGTRLPNLQMPDDVLLPAHGIPAWIAERMGSEVGDLEGYRDEKARDESLAWIALLEGDVHAALMLSQPSPSFILSTLLQIPTSTDPPVPEKLLAPPPALASGLLSLLPPFGTRIPADAVEARYHDAIAALSERLGSDRWFLGSAGPTALDALAFAYVHTLLNSADELRVQVARRVNLVTWERRVYEQIRGAFVSVDGVRDGLVL